MSTKSSFVEQFGPRVRVRTIDRAKSGSPGKFSLKPTKGFEKTVSVARVLARQGVSLSAAKHAVEKLAEGQATAIHIPHVDDREALRAELARLGVQIAELRKPSGEDLAKIRNRLGLSQEQFANTYAFELRTLQNWEQGRTVLDAQASLLVKALDRYPELMEKIAADA